MGMFALQFAIINRPHLYAKHKMRPIVTYVPWSVCVCIFVVHSHEPYKNGSTDRGAV